MKTNTDCCVRTEYFTELLGIIIINILFIYNEYNVKNGQFDKTDSRTLFVTASDTLACYNLASQSLHYIYYMKQNV